MDVCVCVGEGEMAEDEKASNSGLHSLIKLLMSVCTIYMEQQQQQQHHQEQQWNSGSWQVVVERGTSGDGGWLMPVRYIGRSEQQVVVTRRRLIQQVNNLQYFTHTSKHY